MSAFDLPVQVTETAGNGATVVKVSGSVDSLSAEEVRQALSVVPAHRLVADFSDVSYTSSAGMRSLLATVKRCRQDGGDLRFAALQPQVSRVLRISGFASLIKVFDNVATAVASFDAVGVEA